MMHGGGANRTEKLRRGIILSYNLAWLAQGEKLLLSVPPTCARTLPERAQRLIGYQTHRPSLGWIEGRDPIEWLHGRFTAVAPAGDHLRCEHSQIVDDYYLESPRRAEALS
jgi:ectoine hydroxylase-related dioxygenase (phytanoyl-CoA dioxygenase family)